jgi:DNA-binding NarL/FixJ family response regulator
MAAGCCKVVLVGHRPHVCVQVRLAIERRSDLIVVGEAANYAGALAIAAGEAPDFIVVDLAADDDAAVDHIADLVQACRHVVVVSDAGDDEMLDRVMRAGVTDVVPREEAVKAITKWRLFAGRGRAPLASPEQAVMELAGEGLNDKERAGLLMTSEAAVSEEHDSIVRKTKLRDRFELHIYRLYRDLASRE